ncbi:glycosyltransferase family 2 protein [Thalassolituus oleivorans]|uniref:glycosyltransferase family 2 protein n=1 Tax=Thalassolituus oleivorans TaxID=187493 RepID=UPI0023F3D852|nr:glycosyltransferase family 2 protein [Thalassolituus oleivorans]
MLNIVIPMAGRGSRFAKEGYRDPKPLILLDNKRMIEVVINNLRPLGEHRFIFVCQNQHLKEYNLNEKLIEWAPGSVVVGIDGVTDGAACTVLCAKKYIDNDEPLMIANSDQWVDVDINKYLESMVERDLDGLIMTMKADDPKWSYAKVEENGLVSEVVEKIVVSDEATVGIYNYRKGADFVSKAEKMIRNQQVSNGEYYVAPVYTYMYEEDGAKIGVFNIGEEASGMYGLGIPSDLELFKSLEVYTQAIDF